MSDDTNIRFENEYAVEFAVTHRARLKGLRKHKDVHHSKNVTMLLAPCRDVHTFGMTQSIDIAFVNCCGQVIASYTGIKPRMRRRAKRSCIVLERLHTDTKSWFKEGDYLKIVPKSFEEQKFKNNKAHPI